MANHRWSDSIIGTRLYIFRAVLNIKKLINFWSIKTNNNFTINVYDWHAHLATLFNHLLLSGCIPTKTDINIFVSNILGFKIFLGEMAEVTRRGAVYCDFWHEGYVKIIFVYR